ncbi:MAG: phosphoglucomutase/phosphomannomutase family protein [Chloroflexi bacterium]|nr:phosphoglucomutase/phosphomannomutase family protein [Chloroflexota bacterium]MBU1750021.1 phosphoglucomutase/phosphomannomutase family protein [Chloroflexota bacterium]
MSIHFGTDGWRAVISDEFTFANVRLVAQALADCVLADGLADQGVVIGYDTRFLSDRYAMTVARVLAGNGIPVRLAKSDCPTPALSFAVRDQGAAGGVMITASHNPPRYNGIKLKAHHGGSAPRDYILRVEQQLAHNERTGREPRLAPDEAGIQRFDPLPLYLAHIQSLVNLNSIGQSGLRVLIDPMYGAGRGYLRRFLTDVGCPVLEIHGDLNPGFGGLHPEPIGRHLNALRDAIQQTHYDVGLATDGDADRIGAMDSQGQFVDPHSILTILLRHLVETRHQCGAVVKTISTTARLNVLAQRYGLALHETPVGFDHICQLMLTEDVLIGGEESGGMSIKGHIPEGDGLLAGLLLLEALASAGVSLSELLDQIANEVGRFYYRRHDAPSNGVPKLKLVEHLLNQPPTTLAGQSVVHINSRDGVKYILADDSWLLIRPSGTEPVLRLYAEARSPDMVEALLRESTRLAGV